MNTTFFVESFIQSKNRKTGKNHDNLNQTHDTLKQLTNI